MITASTLNDGLVPLTDNVMVTSSFIGNGICANVVAEPFINATVFTSVTYTVTFVGADVMGVLLTVTVWLLQLS